RIDDGQPDALCPGPARPSVFRPIANRYGGASLPPGHDRTESRGSGTASGERTHGTIPYETSSRLNDLLNRAGNSLVLRQFRVKLFLSGGGQPVVARASIARCDAPLRGHPSFDEHAL